MATTLAMQRKERTMSAVALLERTALAEVKKTTINLRVPQQTRELIDKAAAVVGKSRTEFMLESARQHAIDVLLDRQIFLLDAEQFKAFSAVLQNPPRANIELKKLFASKSPWEK
jgi:uncharacterized protein (DUF1778 family)